MRQMPGIVTPPTDLCKSFHSIFRSHVSCGYRPYRRFTSLIRSYPILSVRSIPPILTLSSCFDTPIIPEPRGNGYSSFQNKNCPYANFAIQGQFLLLWKNIFVVILIEVPPLPPDNVPDSCRSGDSAAVVFGMAVPVKYTPGDNFAGKFRSRYRRQLSGIPWV